MRMKLNNEFLSIVITSIGNVHYIKRALTSVYNQTFKNFEVIVVLDKFNEEVVEYLKSIQERKKNLIFFTNKESVGGSEARNIGIRNAKYEWVALLDDDDEWEPTKIESQLTDIVNKIPNEKRDNVISCTFLNIVNTDTNLQKKFPKKNYDNKNDLGDYLFGIRFGRNNGAIQTSSILASKKLFLKIPFLKDLPKHQDWDWLIKCKYFNKSLILQLPEAYTKYYTSNSLGSVSKKNSWNSSKLWINEYKNVVSKNAYESFLMSVVVKGILLDDDLSDYDKKKEIRQIKKEISLMNRLSVFSFRLRILYLLKK